MYVVASAFREVSHGAMATQPPVFPAILCPIKDCRLLRRGTSYLGLRLLLERRAKRAKLSNKPKLHGFRRAFALNMLRSGVDIFVLQRLMRHSDLQVLRRYLAQNDRDNQLAHMRGSPVDNNL
jgi:integrase